MGVNCAGEHECDSPRWPKGKGESYRCNECGQRWKSYCVGDMPPKMKKMLQLAGQDPYKVFGWRSV